MSTPQWVNFKERCYGYADPEGNEDTYNRASLEIWENFVLEHDKDGDHKADLLTDAGVCKQEIGTYTGNATDNRTISLTNASLDVKFVRVWSADVAYTFFATESMPYDITMSTAGVSAADRIQTMGTGSFEVGASDDVNKNTITFYYSVWGTV